MRRIALYAAVLSLLIGLGVTALAGRQEAKKDPLIYEMRTYYPAPGKLEPLLARFRNHTVKLFEKHGMVNVGYWVTQSQNPDEKKLVYILGHKSRDAARASFGAFAQDPEWKTAREESEKNGPLVAKLESVFMDPTDFSKLK